MIVRVALYAPFRIPNACCVCLEPSEQSIEARHSSFLPLGPAVRVTSSSFPVPFCARHARITRRRMLYCKMGMIISFVASLATFFFIGERVNQAPALLFLPAGLFLTAIILGFAERKQVPVRLNSPQAAQTRLVGKSTLAFVILACKNPAFAEALRKINPTARRLGGAQQ